MSLTKLTLVRSSVIFRVVRCLCVAASRSRSRALGKPISMRTFSSTRCRWTGDAPGRGWPSGAAAGCSGCRTFWNINYTDNCVSPCRCPPGSRWSLRHRRCCWWMRRTVVPDGWTVRWWESDRNWTAEDWNFPMAIGLLVVWHEMGVVEDDDGNGWSDGRKRMD